MSDKLRLDGHKLHLHPQRVAAFLAGQPIAPIYIEISPTNRCNLRCRFCALEYRQGESCDIDHARLQQLLCEFAEVGVRSVCFAGEGEPLLYPYFAEAVMQCARGGLHCAVATNGTCLDRELAVTMVRNLTWVKISLNAIRPATYAEIHRCSADNLERVLAGIAMLVEERRRCEGKATIGVQAVLLPENAGEMVEMAGRLRELGVDYFVIKPFNQNMHSSNTEYRRIDYRQYLWLAEPLQELSNDGFRVVFRLGALHKVISEQRPYGGCLGINFFALVHSDGNLYTCAPHSGVATNCYGNVYLAKFGEIWNSERRRAVSCQYATTLADCPVGCRLDEINRYLWELQHPSPHVNFI